MRKAALSKNTFIDPPFLVQAMVGKVGFSVLIIPMSVKFSTLSGDVEDGVTETLAESIVPKTPVEVSLQLTVAGSKLTPLKGNLTVPLAMMVYIPPGTEDTAEAVNESAGHGEGMMATPPFRLL
jgi:hypothetical protein